MKFLIDAQLPFKIKLWLTEKGHDTVHTLDLPDRNNTEDRKVAAVADSENRILISKDTDFIRLKVLNNTPKRLLLVTTGNIDNSSLIGLIESNFELIERLFESFEIVELGNAFVVGRNPN